MTTDKTLTPIETTAEEAEDILDMFNKEPSNMFDDAPETVEGEQVEDAEITTTEEPEEVKPEVKVEDTKDADEKKRMRDEYSKTRNAQKTQYRVLKALEDDGLLDRDDIAAKVGMTRGEIDHILDHKPTTSPDEPDYDKELFRTFDESIKNPVLKRAVNHMYGTDAELNELMAAFNWGYQADPTIRENLRNVLPDDAVYHILDTAKSLKDDYVASKEGGSLIEQNRKLKAKIAELESGESGGNGAAKPAVSKSSQLNKVVAPSVNASQTAAITPRQQHIASLAR